MAKVDSKTVTTVESVEEVKVIKEPEVFIAPVAIAKAPTSGDIKVIKAFMADPNRYALGACEIEVAVNVPQGQVFKCHLNKRLLTMTKIRFASAPCFIGTGEDQKVKLYIDNNGLEGRMYHAKESIGTWEIL